MRPAPFNPSAMRAGLKPDLRAICEPAAILRSLYGVKPGQWSCPVCGAVYELSAYPATRCACSRPLPRRCNQPGCTVFVEPTRDDDDSWNDPAPTCDKCDADDQRRTRGEVIQRVFPGRLLALCRDYWRNWPHRTELDNVLAGWLEGNCGRNNWRPFVVAYGDTGTGKSVALTYHAAAAYYGKRTVRSVFYVTEEDLCRCASVEWNDEHARDTLEWCHRAELLVLDECGSDAATASDLTRAQVREYRRLIKGRLDRGEPTLIATNRPPPVLSWLDTRCESRLAETGVVVRCEGIDMRKAAL